MRQFFLPRLVQQAARLLYNVVSRHTGAVRLSRTFILQLCDCRALLHYGPYVSCTTVLLSQDFIHYTHNRIAKCFIPIVNAKSHVHFFSAAFSTIHFSVGKIYFSARHFITPKSHDNCEPCFTVTHCTVSVRLLSITDHISPTSMAEYTVSGHSIQFSLASLKKAHLTLLEHEVW